MKVIDYIRYTYKHRLIVIKLAEKYFKDNEEILDRVIYHDLDKLYLYLFYSIKDIPRIHRELTSHHENNIKKNYLDYVEMVLDWESARYTKPDKLLNAYETLNTYYPNMYDQIIPILKEIGIDKEKLPMDDEILLYAKELENVSDKEIVDNLKSKIEILIYKE